MAAAAVVGIGSAFSFAMPHHHRPLGHLVFASLTSGGGSFTYYNSQPTGMGLFCQTYSSATDCTFSSSVTAMYFNHHYSGLSNFPVNGQITPVKVTFLPYSYGDLYK